MRISVVLAPVRDTPDHLVAAEELGFHAAWVYDSPLLYHDPFVTLARAAERTRRLGLGVGVLVPGLRTTVATASALRSIAALAPGRVRVALGAGFTGRLTLGLGPVPVARLEREVRDLRALLAGGEALHSEGGSPVRLMPVVGAEGGEGPVAVWVSCRAPRAQILARALGDGAMTGIFYPGGLPLLRSALGPDLPLAVHAVAAVADEGEPLDSPRMAASAGLAVAVAFHGFTQQPWRLEGVEPELRRQAEVYATRVRAALPADRLHLELHRGHLSELVLPQDRAMVTPANVRRFAFAGTASELRARADELAASGVDELVVQPGGDVPDGLRRLAAALLA